MPWFEHNTARIYYEEQGQGEAVLLLPGFAGSIEEFAPLREALAGRYRVISADLPGSGRSGPQPRQYTATYYHDDAQSFIALLKHLGSGPARLLGFSDGGEVSLLMAELDEELTHSIAAWGAAGVIVDEQGLLDAFYDVVDKPIEPLQEFAEYLKSAYGESNARAMTQSFVRALRMMIQQGGDISRSKAATISCPVLLLVGENDFIATPALVSQLAEAIPSAEFVLVPGAGHDIYTERPEWLTQSLVDWLRQK